MFQVQFSPIQKNCKKDVFGILLHWKLTPPTIRTWRTFQNTMILIWHFLITDAIFLNLFVHLKILKKGLRVNLVFGKLMSR